MINIEIDGEKLEVKSGSMIIEAADAAGIYIPRFCYHKKLSIAANCRMCLVEVEKSRKPLPACATPVTEGMRVFTKSPAAIHSQRTVMEFLLINHPLDCPICDQGGQCELQDLSMGYGKGISRYTQGKRAVDGDDLGSLVATDMTRCIHCTRCVRFCEEVAGIKEMGATARGEHMQIGTYVEHALKSEVSGNIIDLCPVGALTSKPFLYQARAWELQQADSIAAHDCLGSNTFIHTRRGEVMRVTPRECEDVNEVWLSDRDRFSYLGLQSEERLGQPMIKENGEWKTVSYPKALSFAVNGLKNIIEKYGASQMAGFASPNSTLEEFYLMQRVMRGIGCNNLDHRLHRTDFSDQDQHGLYPRLGLPVADLEKQNAVLLVGSNIAHEQALIAIRLRRQVEAGCQVMAVNCQDHDYHFNLSEKMIVTPHAMVQALAGIAKVLADKQKENVPSDAAILLQSVKANDTQRAIADKLLSAQRSTLIMGAFAQNHPYAAKIRALVNLIAELTHSVCGALTEGANSSGAWLAGMVPHRYVGGQVADVAGLNIANAWQEMLKAYVLMNVEPEMDCAYSATAMKALQEAEFVVSLNVFATDTMRDYANVILPIAPFTETSGTYINAEGRWQGFKGVANAFEAVRPAWKVWRVLGNLFALDNFEYESSEQVLSEVHKTVQAVEHQAQQWICPKTLQSDNDIEGICVIDEWAIYRGDAIVRRAIPLQQSAASPAFAVRMHPDLAKEQGLQDAEYVCVKRQNETVTLPLILDNKIPLQAVVMPAGYAKTSVFDKTYGTVTLTQG